MKFIIFDIQSTITKYRHSTSVLCLISLIFILSIRPLTAN